jgi:hypothetical protein
MSKGAFAKVAGASATGGGNNIRDGVYKLLVESLVVQNGHSGECFIAEFRVLEATANGAVNEQGQPVIPNAVGSTCSMVCNLTKHESAAGNAKAFVVGALAGLGYTEAQITPDVMGHICSEHNPLRGLAVIDETYVGVNKGRSNPANAGKKLTLNKWKPIQQTEDDVKTQRAYLDSNVARADAGAPAAASSLFSQTVATPAPTEAAKPAGGGLLGILGPKQ